MKKTFFILLILFSSGFVFAQNELLIQKDNKGLYLNHTVTPKENFYSIGRLYNISPKEIAAFNNLDMSKGLKIGETLKIPLTAENFSQKSSKGRAVYYEVGQKEGLYRVSVNNNNVLMASLRKWNHLTNDKITPGEKLVVGYLVSAEAGKITAPETENNTVAEKNDPVQEQPKQETAMQSKEQPVIEKKEEKNVEQKPSDNRNDNKVTNNATENHPVTQNQYTQVSVPDVNGSGYFKTQFEKQIKIQPVKNDATATAGIFKTASGWQDGKYYALLDHVEPGTIIMIINPTNNKAIYAKVLGEMSNIRQNEGYGLRISNAAANALDITDTDKFIVRVNY